MSTLQVDHENLKLAAVLAHAPNAPSLHWLGQAGFVVRGDNRVTLIDPYLSDALAQKYAGTAVPHERMMQPPIRVEELPRIDAVLVTHRHGDHMDRVTLPQIAALSPACKFVVPRSELAAAIALGIDHGRFIPVDAGETVLLDGLRLHAIPAAHESLERDEAGHHHYLGYVLKLGDLTLYHSGDCVPFEGLTSALRPFEIDLALLPVNGRDPVRNGMGIPGNFTLEEAADLCLNHEIPAMIGHHYGMFAFNTIDPALIEQAAAALGDRLQLIAATVGATYQLHKGARAGADHDEIGHVGKHAARRTARAGE